MKRHYINYKRGTKKNLKNKMCIFLHGILVMLPARSFSVHQWNGSSTFSVLWCVCSASRLCCSALKHGRNFIPISVQHCLNMSEDMSQNKASGIQRVISKIENNIRNGNFYEAHQMYKTLYFRFMAQKKYLELLNSLYDGASLLLEHDQQGSGVDLGLLYIDVLVKSKTPVNDEYIKNVGKLFSLINANVPERDSFLSAAVRWCDGAPLLHQSVAQTYWKEKNYVMARKHFLRSYDGSSFGTMLVELHRSSGYTSEVDLFIAQTVLQCLCLKNKKTAVITFQCYTTQHPSITKGPPYLLPLLNFIWFLLQVVDSGRLGAFTILCQEYQLSLERDPSYMHYLDRIGQIFFNVPPPPSRSSGLFGGILESLVQSLDDYNSDEESNPLPPPSAQSRRPTATTSHATNIMETDLD